MIPLDHAADRVEAGGKARTLARARAAGLPVLDGFVVLPGEEIDEGALAQELSRLGGERFAVRSSATVEDLPGASAAGVFESVVGVLASEVAQAIERVRVAVRRQAAVAYLGARGLSGRRLEMAVLVQPLANAARLGVVRSVAELEGALPAEERDAGEPEHGRVQPRLVAPDEPLGVLARRAEALLGGPVDVEYAVGAEGPILLQARPLTAAPSPRPARHPSRWSTSERADERGRLLLDDDHNPAPLSEAQASLVRRLERVPGLGGQRLLHGWLYVRAAETSSAGAADEVPISSLRSPARVFDEEVVPAAEALLGPLEREGEPALAAVLPTFDEVARLHGALLRPVLRAARGALDRLLQCSIGQPLSAHGALLGGCGGRTLERDQRLWELGRAEAAGDTVRAKELLARLLAEHGAFAPAWEVAVACDDEEPERVRRAARLVARAPAPDRRHAHAVREAEAAALRIAERLDPASRARFSSLLPLAREALRVAEDDDALFFRAQRLVRRALLSIGRRAVAQGRLDGAWQIVDLPIEEVLADALDAGRARGLSALREARARLDPPSVIEDGVPSWRGQGGQGAVLSGAGTGGRGYGRALLVRAGQEPSVDEAQGAVLVMRAVLPSQTFLLPAAAGLVTDVGGALGHAATLAREYGIAAVLGTGSASRAIADGEDLIVDGDHGRVYRLGGRSGAVPDGG